MSTNTFYVYRWIRLDTNTPFYVGKGKGKRAFLKKHHRNQYFRNIVKAVATEVEIIIENLTEEQAFQKEIEFIKLYKDLGYCEANLTLGGEGRSGSKMSSAQKEILRKVHTGNKYSLGKPSPKKGISLSEETRKKISKANAGKRCGSENYKAISVIDSLGNQFDTVKSAADFHKILSTSVTNILTGWAKKTRQGVTFAYLKKVGG